MSDEDRELGFYWVELSEDEWVVAQWEEYCGHRHWSFPGFEGYMGPVVEVDERRLVRPPSPGPLKPGQPGDWER